MKKSILLTALAALLLYAGTAVAQTDRRISINVQEMPIRAALKQLEKAASRHCVYEDRNIDPQKRVTLQHTNEKLETILDDFSRQTSLHYEVRNNLILIFPPREQQTRRETPFHLEGVVTDENNEPVIGATVILAGSHSGTITDTDGKFSLQVISGDLLTVSFVGMTDKVIKVIPGMRSADVKMKSSLTTLENVVVTGYQTLSGERATGAFGVINHKQLDKAAGNIGTRLLGAAAGLVGSQDVYGNPTFRIRGSSSFSASNTPLLVVDGFAIAGGFESINPNDVESVTVLKDAAAASIWGARSANGVIVITTKSGKAKDSPPDNTIVSVNYSGFYKASPKMDLDYALSRISSSDQIDYEKETFTKWGAHLFYPEETDAFSSGSSVYYLLNEHRLGHITESEMNAGIEKLRHIDNTGQIRKYILQHPMVLQQNIGINIQTRRSTTALSLLYQNSHSHWKGNSSKKYMVSFRNRTTLYSWLDLHFAGTCNYTYNNPSGPSGLPNLFPYENLTDDKGDLIRYSLLSPHYLNTYVPLEEFPYADWSWNPLDDVRNRKLRTTSLNTRLQAGVTLKILKGLTFDSKLLYEMTDSHSDKYYNENSYTVRNLLNTTSTWDRKTNSVKANLPLGGILDRSRSLTDILTIRNQISLNRTFDRHHIAFTAGTETIDNRSRYFGYARTYGYNDQSLSVGTLPGEGKVKGWNGYKIDLLGAAYNGKDSFSDATDRYFSAFGNLSYTLDNKYTLSGSYRTDASNLITDDPSYRYAPFWSAGAGWRISKENFMKPILWIDNLNLRLTYGFNGNVDKSTTFKPLMSVSSTPHPITGEYIASIASYGNPTLRWEKTGTWDLGIDFDLLGHRLYGKIDFYHKLSKDLIANREISAVNGTTQMRLNNGKIQNHGVELEIGSALDITRHISWTGNLTLAYNKNKVKSLKVKQHYGYTLVTGSWVEGEDMNTLWCYEYAGLINTGSEASPHYAPSVYYEDRKKVGFTSYLYGDGTRYCLNMGTRTAPWSGSLSSSFKVYDFELSFLLTGKFGHKFKRESYNYPAPTGDRRYPNSKYYEILHCDPELVCPQPLQDNESRYYFWDRFYPYLSYLVEDASHIRMQEISLYYHVPRKITGLLGMKSAQLFIQCNNPFNIYFNKYHEDPEYPKGTARLQISCTFGAKLNF